MAETADPRTKTETALIFAMRALYRSRKAAREPVAAPDSQPGDPQEEFQVEIQDSRFCTGGPVVIVIGNVYDKMGKIQII